MKKILAGVIGVIGILIVALGIEWKMKKAVSISIIGGADGPTSVFLAGKVGNDFSLAAIVLGIILVVLILIVLAKRKHRDK